MKKFYEWGHHGIMTEINSESITSRQVNENEKSHVYEKEIFENLYASYKKIGKDFINKYGDSDIWPKSYKKVDLSTEAKNTKIAFLKYNYENVLKTKQFHGTSSAFHSDFFQQDMDSPGYKLIFTVMVYLNDDYEGGEIAFFDGEKIIAYKPKSGDAVVFPSCEPFYHGVLATDKSDRYAIRMNYCIETEGSDEFKSGNYTPSSNQTNYKVPFTWKQDGIRFATSPGMGQSAIFVDPPSVITVNQMERVAFDA
jgi:hypothetical protein